MRTLLISALTLLALVALAIGGYFFGFLRFNYPSPAVFPVRGIDVSAYQGEIDWPAVAQDGYRFAYIKATEGGDFTDQRFKRNWSKAKHSGLFVGAYHFFTFCKPGSQQALNFVRTVPEDTEALPPVIDFELGGNCKKPPPKEVVLKELFTYIAIVRLKYRKKPIFYITEESYAEYLKDNIAPYGLWARNIFRKPGRFEGQAWQFWQYSHNGRVNGIHGWVDQNVFHGSEKEFLSLLSQ